MQRTDHALEAHFRLAPGPPGVAGPAIDKSLDRLKRTFPALSFGDAHEILNSAASAARSGRQEGNGLGRRPPFCNGWAAARSLKQCRLACGVNFWFDRN